MNDQTVDRNRRMLRARDAMDRSYAEPLDVRALGRIAQVSEAHFIRAFKETFGETPHRYLQRRRVERAMFLLREPSRSVTDICFDVGFNSLGTFSRTFTDIVGLTPSAYRRRSSPIQAPTCFAMSWSRPSQHVPRPVDLFAELSHDAGSPPAPAAAVSEKRQAAAADYHAPRSGQGTTKPDATVRSRS